MKKNKIKPVLSRLFISSMVFISIFSFYLGLNGHKASANIDTKDEACRALNSTAGTGMDCTDPAKAGEEAQTGIDNLLASATNVLSFLVGGISVIMLTIGGFKYVTSNGDTNQTKSAKDTVMYALIGLLLVGFAQTLVRFVWSKT